MCYTKKPQFSAVSIIIFEVLNVMLVQMDWNDQHEIFFLVKCLLHRKKYNPVSF